jgi:hypothetical protein
MIVRFDLLLQTFSWLLAIGLMVATVAAVFG